MAVSYVEGSIVKMGTYTTNESGRLFFQILIKEKDGSELLMQHVAVEATLMDKVQCGFKGTIIFDNIHKGSHTAILIAMNKGQPLGFAKNEILALRDEDGSYFSDRFYGNRLNSFKRTLIISGIVMSILPGFLCLVSFLALFLFIPLLGFLYIMWRSASVPIKQAHAVFAKLGMQPNAVNRKFI